MIDVPTGHVGGVPVEEALAACGPALFLAFGAASAGFGARLRALRARSRVRTKSR